jgi:hypothetical protein
MTRDPGPPIGVGPSKRMAIRARRATAASRHVSTLRLYQRTDQQRSSPPALPAEGCAVEALACDELRNRPSSQLRHLAHRFAQRHHRGDGIGVGHAE